MGKKTTRYTARRKHQGPAPTYTHADVLAASATDQMPPSSRTHHLTVMWDGLASIESAPWPSVNDWRVCSDAVNFMETLVETGHCEDERGLIHEAVTALAKAAKRNIKGHPIRLDGAGIQAVRSALEDYAAVLDTISHQQAVLCHMRTERRIRGILIGKRRPHDVEIVSV
jgi:hypothetical protein